MHGLVNRKQGWDGEEVDEQEESKGEEGRRNWGGGGQGSRKLRTRRTECGKDDGQV